MSAKSYSLQDILPLIPVPHVIAGDPDGKSFVKLRPTLDADNSSLVFIATGRTDAQEMAEKTKALLIICDPSIDTTKESLSEKIFVIVDDPKFVFARIGNILFSKKPTFGIHPTAVMHSEAEVHTDTYIGPFTYIGKCKVDSGTIIYGNCYLYDNTQVGKNVIINAGCIIGAEGFGYLKNEEFHYENFPHLGGVVIEDNVEIGSNTCIDRGALNNTIIKSGAKIDNLVHIAHNVVVENNALVIANAMIGGSTVIGKNSWIAPSATIRDTLKIGDNVTIGMGAVVTKNVPDDQTFTGSPARLLSEFLEIQKKLKAL